MKLEEIFVAQFMLATGDQLNSIAAVRYSFSSRLYYRTLLSMLKQVRLCSQFTSHHLVQNDHYCFFLCCVTEFHYLHSMDKLTTVLHEADLFWMCAQSILFGH